MADVTMPQLGETVTEGTITKWFKKVGDEVKADEPLFEVSTDKVDTEVPSPIAGTLSEIKAQEGDTVEVGAVIAVVGDAGAAAAPAAPAETAETTETAADEPPAAEAAPAPAPAAAEPAPAQAAPEPPAAEPVPAAPAAAAAPPPPSTTQPEPTPVPPRAEEAAGAGAPSGDGASAGGDNRLLSPVVRRLIADNDLDPAQITGTGPGGRITRDDVLDHLDRRAAGAPVAAGAAEDPPAHRRPHDHVEAGHAPRLQRGGGRLRQRRRGPQHGEGPVEGERGFQPHLPAVHQPGGDRRPRRVPAPQRERR
jgi:pyruvate dehydrogenase E2 component (dihydrolipoamide acetyltransferase)